MSNRLGGVNVRTDRGVAEVTWATGPAAPATLPMLTALRDSIRQTSSDSDVAVVVLGAAPVFGTGFDLREMATWSREDAVAHYDAVADVVAAIGAARPTTIAAVHSYAIGAAFELVNACDVRVAADNVLAGFIESVVGIPVPFGARDRITFLAGEDVAEALLGSGQLFDANELADWGLVDAVELPAGIDDAVAALAHDMAAHPNEVGRGRKRRVADGAEAACHSARAQAVAAIDAKFADGSWARDVGRFLAHGPRQGTMTGR